MMNSVILLFTVAAATIVQLTVCSNKDFILDLNTGSDPNILGCHLVHHEVNFKELGLPFVIKPKRINIGDCQGYCSETYSRLNMTSNTMIRSLLPDPPTPCCVPVEFRPVQVLLSLYNNTAKRFSIKVDRLNDAVVSKCGCL